MIKGLEALEIIKSIQTNNYDRRINDYTSVNEEYEYEISIIEKELKALEILKGTRNIEVYFFDNRKRHYRIKFDKTREQAISLEQYTILNEVLGYEKQRSVRKNC